MASGIDTQASRIVMPAASTSSPPRLRITAQPAQLGGMNAQLVVALPRERSQLRLRIVPQPVLLVELSAAVRSASSLSRAAFERVAQRLVARPHKDHVVAAADRLANPHQLAKRSR